MKQSFICLTSVSIFISCSNSGNNNANCTPETKPDAPKNLIVGAPPATPPANQPAPANCPAPAIDDKGKGGLDEQPKTPGTGDTPGSLASLTDIQGSWASECISSGNTSSYFNFNFDANGAVIQTIQSSFSTNCADLGMMAEAQGNAKKAGDSYQIVWSKLSVLPYMENFAQGFNRAKTCGFQDWQQGTEKQLTPTQCKNDQVFGDVAKGAKYKIVKNNTGLLLQDLNQAGSAPVALKQR